ncbi:hypothetical protein, partial [Stieleria sp.]|uniref:hypothetical protein n=1 Tax=Stieleria sp. TaxID=2795976 RepID=UPI003567CB61
GAAESLSEVSASAIDFSATAPTETLAAAAFRDVQSTGVAGVTVGSEWSGSSIIAGYANQGAQAIEQYCFPAGTEILLADGRTKPIEAIAPGDLVASRPQPDHSHQSHPPAHAKVSHQSHPPVHRRVERSEGRVSHARLSTAPGTVTETYHNAPQQLLHVHIGDTKLATTAGHPFYVINRPTASPQSRATTWNLKPETCNSRATTWNLKPETCNSQSATWNLKPETCNSPAATWKLAADLTPGDQLTTADNVSLTITAITRAASPPVPVFNFCVAEHHNYHVRLPGTDHFVLVHNESFGTFTYGLEPVPEAQQAFSNSALGELMEYASGLFDAAYDAASPYLSQLDSAVSSIQVSSPQWLSSLGGSLLSFASDVGASASGVASAVGTQLADATNHLLIDVGNLAIQNGLFQIGGALTYAGQTNAVAATLSNIDVEVVVATGALVVGSAAALIASGGTALPLVAGMWAGAIDVYIQGELSGQGAGFAEIALGATFGWLDPIGAVGGLAGGVIGYAGADALGLSGAEGYMLGSLIGGIAGTGVAATGRGGSILYAARAMAQDAGGAGIGFAYGQLTGQDFSTSLQYAFYGQMIGGTIGALTVKCFVAGTPVHIPSSDPDQTSATIPIEQLRVGQRVLGENPLIERDDACLLEPDWSQYVAVTAKVFKRDGDVLELTTLKPDIWLKRNNVRVGKRTLMDIPVADAHNEALITAINPNPDIQPGPGRVILSTFRHT